jgi:ribonuclease R
VQVLLDRIDRQQRRLQFALVPKVEAETAASGLRKGKAAKAKDLAAAEGGHMSPDRSGKPKGRKGKVGKTKTKAASGSKMGGKKGGKKRR